jgi:predicted permease
METLLTDLRYGLRALVRRPGFALGAAATLSLGIAATTAMFTVVDAVLLRPLPLPEPDRIVRLEERHPAGRLNLTGATFRDVRTRARSLAHAAVFRTYPFNLAGQGPAEPVTAARVSPGFFAVIGGRPLRGRLFAPDEFLLGGDRVAVVGEGLWRRWFGADEAAIGRRVRLDGEMHVVVGVLPDRLRFPGEAQVWLPLGADRTLPWNRRSHLFNTLGRLGPGVSLDEARSELTALAAQIQAEEGDEDERLGGLLATPLQERLTEGVRPALLALMGAVGLLLLVSWVNVASLLLARGAQRSRDVAIRRALGAGRRLIVRQLLTESVLLALLGALPGVALAAAGTRALHVFLPEGMPRTQGVGVDTTALSFALVLSLASAVAFGLWPAVQIARIDLRPALAPGVAGTQGRGRLRGALVVSEVALLTVLLGGAGLLTRTFLALRSVPLGLSAEGVLTFYVSPAGDAYRSAAGIAAFVDEALGRLRGLPGADGVVAATALPTRPLPWTSFRLEGPSGGEPGADVLAVSPGYFRLLGIPLLAGRPFEEADGLGAPVAVVLSRLAAETFWPGRSPLGRRVTLLHWDEPLEAHVVGVVGEVRHRGPGEESRPTVYFSHRQFADRVLGWYFLVRAAGDPTRLAGPARERIHGIDPDQPLSGIRTLDQVQAGALAQRRFTAQLAGVFAALALALVVVGVHGVVSLVVGERTREIGIRLALGARSRDVVRQVARYALRLVLAGLAVGLTCSVLIGRGLAGLLFGVGSADPGTLGAVCAVIVGVGLLAAWTPARRAAAVDPAVTLRSE